jgi:hypothetical protein
MLGGCSKTTTVRSALAASVAAPQGCFTACLLRRAAKADDAARACCAAMMMMIVDGHEN